MIGSDREPTVGAAIMFGGEPVDYLLQASYQKLDAVRQYLLGWNCGGSSALSPGEISEKGSNPFVHLVNEIVHRMPHIT
jgi:hypothetical protein